MSSSLGAMENLQNWKSVELLVFPALAFIYAVSCAVFLPNFRECPWVTHLQTIFPRLTVLVMMVAVAASLESDQELYFAVLLLFSMSISIYLVIHTRTNVVEGGPPPKLTDMTGKVVLITGANTGIGKETAQQLAAKGATVIMACRSSKRAEAARQDIIDSLPGVAEPKLEVLTMDLSSLTSVKEAAASLKKRKVVVDILILNAGVMMGSQSITDDGYDLVMQANHLGHYLLTRLLLENKGLDTKTGRVLTLTSSTYSYADSIDLEDLFCKKKRKYTLFGQYAQSKLANILFTKELDKRFPDLFTAAVHPGLVRTDVVRNMPWYLYYPNIAFSFIMCTLQKTPAQGAWCTTFLAGTPVNDLVSGKYWVNRDVQELWPCADRGAEELWVDSAKYVGLKP